MVAGAPQRLAASPRGKPADGCKNQKKLFVGAPGQGAGDLFRSGLGIAGDGTRDRDIRARGPHGNRHGAAPVAPNGMVSRLGRCSHDMIAINFRKSSLRNQDYSRVKSAGFPKG